MSTRFRTFMLLPVILLITFAINSNAQISNYKAYTLFVYNFTKYVQWPEGVISNEFVIGVFGKSPITEELSKMVAVKKAGDKSIRVVDITESTLNATVHILFIPDDKSAQIASVLAAIKGRPVLVVAEREGTVEKGAAISFMTDHNNLKFELNSGAIASQNLKVSKTLEALAFKGPS